VQDGYVTPETPDNNRISYTAGLSYAIGTHFEVDASFFFTKLSREDTNLETGLSGKFTTIALVPGIGLNYKF
jgi:long-chain fatty acid transport protein